MKKHRMMTGIAAVLAAAFVFCGCGSAGLTGFYENSEKYAVGDASIKDKVENIVIDWTSGEITFTENNADTVDITEELSGTSKEEMRMRWFLDGTTLYVRYSAPKIRLISFGTIRKDLTVALPKGLELEQLKIDATSAKITAKDIKARDLAVDITSGSVDLGCVSENVEIDATSGTVNAVCTADDIDIDATSGKVYLTQKGSSKRIGIEVTSGRIEASAESFERMDLDGTSSDIELTLPEDAGFTAEIDTTSGKFESDFAMKKKDDTYTAGDGSARIRIDVTSGDVYIKEAG